jgi:hypothetical protein
MSTNGPRPSQDPFKPDPLKPDPLKPEPLKPDPLKPEPLKNEPLKPNGGPSAVKPLSQETVPPGGRVNPDPFKPTPASHYTEEPKATPHIESEAQKNGKEPYHEKSTTKKFEEKISTAFQNIKESEKVNEFYSYARSHKQDVITYILLALGLILVFPYPIIGGLILGAVAGYHFSHHFYVFIHSLRELFEQQDRVRLIVLIGSLIGLFILAPGFIIGALLIVAFKQVIFTKGEKDKEGLADDPRQSRDNTPNKYK